jgi:hypothetical protein
MGARALRRVVLLVVSIATGIAAYRLVPAPLPEISRAEFWDEVHAGHVRKIEIYEQETILSDSPTRGEFRTPFDSVKDAGLPDELRALGVEVWYSTSGPTP